MLHRRRDRSISGLLILVRPHKAVHDDDALEKFLPPGQTPAAPADAVRFSDRSIVSLPLIFPPPSPTLFHRILRTSNFQTLPVLLATFVTFHCRCVSRFAVHSRNFESSVHSTVRVLLIIISRHEILLKDLITLSHARRYIGIIYSVEVTVE